jgi:hypothetical protein
MTELIIWSAFSDSGWWCHDEYPVHKFVVVQLVTFFDRVEFLG